MSNKDKQARNEELPVSQRGAEPTGAPEEFGLTYSTAPHEKARCWDRQELLLEAYRRSGKVGQAAVAVGPTRWAHDNWMRNAPLATGIASNRLTMSFARLSSQ